MRILPRIRMALAFLMASSTAHALSVPFTLKPGKPGEKIHAGGFVFEISAQAAANNEVKFHVVITEETGSFAGLMYFKVTNVVEDANPPVTYLHGIKDVVPVMQGKSAVCDFTATTLDLGEPDACFTFQNIHGTPSRYMTAPPDVDFFYIYLNDFYKPSADATPKGGGAGTPALLKLTEADGGKSATAAKGAEVSVALAGNPTTGYSWVLLSGNDAVLKSAGEPVYDATPATAVLVGAGGNFTFKFQAVAAGTAALKFGYERPWEKGVVPAKTFEVTVRVP